MLHSDTDAIVDVDEGITRKSTRRMPQTKVVHATVEDTLFFAVMGKHTSMQTYSERLDLVLDALQGGASAETPPHSAHSNT